MPQAFADRYHVRAVGDCKAGRRVAQLVRVETFNAIALPELLKEPCRCLRVHWLRAGILSKYPFADAGAGLLILKLTQQINYLRANINGAGLAVFR